MLNPRLIALADYPFDRLRALLDGLEPPAGLHPYVLSVGEPRHPAPTFISEDVSRAEASWGRYPPIEGTPALRQAITGWLQRRYGLAPGWIDPDRHVLPVVGTREALYLIAQVALGPRPGGKTPVVVVPNPFYHVYAGAALMHGAELVCLPATRETGYLPDLKALAPAQRDRTALIYLCSPANPQGAVADAAYLTHAIALARDLDAVLIVDECYAEIYSDDPPAGALQVCAQADGSLANVVVFHSLSKRSSVPGLRSGFVAGDAAIIGLFRRLRTFGGATMPLPVQAASARLWQEEAHVTENRALYQAKMALAEQEFGTRFGFFRPAGGFFLWLDVGDGEAAARRLWREAAIRVLPGTYMGRSDAAGHNPGHRYIRVALIDDLAATQDALRRIGNTL